MPPRRSESKQAAAKAATTPAPRTSSTRGQSKPHGKAATAKTVKRELPSSDEEEDNRDAEPFILNGKPDPIPFPLIAAGVIEANKVITTLCKTGFYLGDGAIIRRSDGSPLLAFRIHSGPIEVKTWSDGYDDLPFAGWVSAPLAFLLAKMHCLVRVRVEIELDAKPEQRSVEPIYEALYHSCLLAHVLKSLPKRLKKDAVPDRSAFEFPCHALDCWIARLAHDTTHDTEERAKWMKEHGKKDHSPYEGLWSSLGMSSNFPREEKPSIILFSDFVRRLVEATGYHLLTLPGPFFMDGSFLTLFPVERWTAGLDRIRAMAASEQGDAYLQLLEVVSREWDYSPYLTVWDHLLLPNFRHFILPQRLNLSFNMQYVADKSFMTISNAQENTVRHPYPVKLGKELVCRTLYPG